jgi:hypothetical protein
LLQGSAGEQDAERALGLGGRRPEEQQRRHPEAPHGRQGVGHHHGKQGVRGRNMEAWGSEVE